MKNLIIFSLSIGLLLFAACSDKKKEGKIDIEASIQKIDSIEYGVTKDLENLKSTIEQVEGDLKNLKNI